MFVYFHYIVDLGTLTLHSIGVIGVLSAVLCHVFVVVKLALLLVTV